MEDMTYDLKVDALGLLCPLPVLRLRKRMTDLPIGARICLIADDPASQIDVPHFCNEAGHELVKSETTDQGWAYSLIKG